MKFGLQLSNALYSEWRFYYVDYDELKRQLKQGLTGNGGFNDQREAAFVETLERELEKVTAFRNIKGDELTRRVQHCESVVESTLAQGDSATPDAERFARVEEEIRRITMEVTELSKFVRINYTGFLKILKKHDKHTVYMLKPTFMVRMNARPFYKDGFDTLILRLSKLFDTIRTGGKRSQENANAGATQQNFVRRTTKYWVHPDNVTEVKCIILKYLPVLVFSAKGKKEPDPAITSIYFDNDSFDLYLGRLEKTEGAEAIRLRWYGNMDQQEIFVERKTHREDWTGEQSVKSRFPIKEKNVNAYLKGEFDYGKTIEKMRKKNQKDEKELEHLETLAQEVSESVLNKHLHPVVRTFYNRTAFQLPGDARVRISLDTELTLIREDNEGRPRSGDNWRRTDAGTVAPFDYLPSEDVCAFPYAILEVKLQTQHGTEAPKWVDELVNSHLVEEVPKFSKFIHGVATLLESRVSLLPFWLPQMDKDIRKPAPQEWRSLEWSAGASSSRESSVERGRNGWTNHRNQSKASSLRHESDVDSVEVIVEEVEEDADERSPLLLRSGRGNNSRNGNNASSSTQQRRQRTDQPRTRPFSWAGGFGNLFKNDASDSSRGSGNGVVSLQRGASGKAKRIALPVRVEPKVFFANERTFLSWLHFCIVLGGLALGLLNFGDRVGQIAGLVFTLVAMLFMVYALFLYHWRAKKIRNRDAGPYDDRVGPTVLVIVLFFAVLTNFYLKFGEGQN
ncbi:VTC domain-containing protein [Fimicolochytrium jonesii]|uniref:VTC domain-containing protein n=1 Tax=Fimicolochytrium jonesii TaxID=1396493 RepID=UPI0022FDD1C7|nr:VTC domain-containing protein [Fimicolochytrium jonesii]KAI8819939.1 VTC domain-containing protein [Fimicolochytrium jonesii]